MRRAMLTLEQMMGQGHDTSMVDMLDEATLRQYGDGIQVAMDPNDDDDDDGTHTCDRLSRQSDDRQTFRVH